MLEYSSLFYFIPNFIFCTTIYPSYSYILEWVVTPNNLFVEVIYHDVLMKRQGVLSNEQNCNKNYTVRRVIALKDLDS